MSDERDKLLQMDNGCCKSCCSILCTLFVNIFFDWPWKMVMNTTDHRAEDHQILEKAWLICKCIYKPLHVLFIITGALSQLVICFSRLNPYSHWVQESNQSVNANSTTHHCQLKCSIDKHFITAFIFPDTIIVLLSLWILLVELLDGPCCQSCQCLKHCLNINNAENSHFNKLVKASNSPIKIKYALAVVSIIYIILSLGVSIIYLWVFGITRKHVVIHSPFITSSNNDDIWRWVGIVFSIVGFLAFDLLYIQVIMRYAYQCCPLISCLNSIKNSLQEPLVDIESIQEKAKNIAKFLRLLNKSSVAIGIVIIIAGFAAISCIINLLNTTDCPMNNEAIQQLQVVAVTLRLLLWAFIALFSFYKAAEVNAASREFIFELAVYKSPEAEKVSETLKQIFSEARLLGILVHPWLPNMIVFTLFFTIMLGSSIIEYFHLL